MLLRFGKRFLYDIFAKTTDQNGEQFMGEHTFLAFDLGATSGRAVIGNLAGGKLTMEEIHRFPNSILEKEGKYYWDIHALFNELKRALIICTERGIEPQSIGIDTWGVDFGYIASDGTLLGLPRAYRDPYTNGIPEEFFKTMPREELYRRTGIQIMYFNSLYQLLGAKREGCRNFTAADKVLFMPDLLAYMFSGKMVCEYTEATTSQMICPSTKQFDGELLEIAGIKSSLFPPVTMPGSVVGELTDKIAAETGIGKIPVISVAGHDTASAIAAIPATDKEFAFISSGTWSLMGIECESPIINEESCRLNLTNEGGIDGTTCFLNNITGMWLLEECRREWKKEGAEYSYEEIMAMAAEAEPCRCLINPNDPTFTNPEKMTAAIAGYCRMTGQPEPAGHPGIIRCIFDSLALCYRDTLESIREVAPHEIRRIHIIGGGSKNRLMSQLTANATALTVVAGPSEATAIGNCMVQAQAAGLAGDRWEMRRLIGEVVDTETFTPADTGLWQEGYSRYIMIKEKRNRQTD